MFPFLFSHFLHDTVAAKVVAGVAVAVAAVLVRLRDRTTRSSELSGGRSPEPLRRSPDPDRSVVGGGNEDPRVDRIPGNTVDSPGVDFMNPFGP
jgi:hypothetical protein